MHERSSSRGSTSRRPTRWWSSAPTPSGWPSSTRSAAAWAARRERAYAYLLYPSAAALTGEAGQRLAALSDYTELGAGVRIAMRDLEIRGAGNLLGAEQSGHVAALGFELYMQMLDEAVRARMQEGAPEDESEPVRLDVNVDAYVPADYMPYEQAKVDVHRRVAAARDVAELELLREELKDRFGPLPDPLANLIALQQARIKLGQAGARTVSFRGDRLAVAPIEMDSTQAKALRERIPEAVYESAARSCWCGCPGDEGERFPAVVRAADALLETVCAHLNPPKQVRLALACLATLLRVVQRLTRLALALGAFFIAATAFAACGGNNVPGNAVANVDGTLITTQNFTHWLTVAARSQNPTGGGPVSIPDAPTFAKCIAAKQASQPKPAQGQKPPTAAQLKAQCQQEYSSLRDQVMQFLISAQWIQGEAKDQGVKVTDAEVSKRFQQTKKQSFPKETDYQKFLKQSGMTAGGHALPREARRAVEQDPRQGHQGPGHGHPGPDRDLLQQEQVALRSARAARPARSS